MPWRSGHLGEAAALAAPFEAQADPASLDLDQGRMPPVGGDDGIDLAIQDVAHLVRQVSGGTRLQRLTARSDQPHAHDFRNGVADQLLDAPDERQACAGRPAGLERDGAVLDAEDTDFAAPRDHGRQHAGLQRCSDLVSQVQGTLPWRSLFRGPPPGRRRDRRPPRFRRKGATDRRAPTTRALPCCAGARSGSPRRRATWRA